LATMLAHCADDGGKKARSPGSNCDLIGRIECFRQLTM
jgi:hypothetical protein